VEGRSGLMLRVPNVVGTTKFRNDISRIMDAVERGETYIIKGPKDREAYVVNPEMVRQLQDAYLDLVGELETIRIREDEDAMEALRTVAADDVTNRYTLEEIEGIVGEDDK
jgi:hypothetical protein